MKNGSAKFRRLQAILVLLVLICVAGCLRRNDPDASISAAIYENHEVRMQSADRWDQITWKGGPDFCIEFQDGKRYMISELTPEIVKPYFLEYTQIDNAKFQQYYGKEIRLQNFDSFDFSFGTYRAQFKFKDRKLVYCAIEDPIAKVGRKKDEMMFDFPITKDQMIGIFGEPKSYRRHSPKRTFN